MVSGQHGRGTIALIALMAVGVVVALFGVMRWNPLEAPSASRTTLSGQSAPAVTPPAPGPVAALPSPAAGPSTVPAPPPAPGPGAPAGETGPVPSFDIVRVEPNGESVIAGRGAPGATIEMVRSGQVHARTAADQSGLFALVPPPLPPGSHEVVLQSIAPDGTRQRSKESVTIVISEGRDTKPLVALASPDGPTVVLSNPEPPDQTTAQASPAASAGTTEPPGPPPGPAPAPSSRPEIRIVTVEAEEGGRLFVSGQAAPGATVRLYLNESFIAPGGVGRDGRVSFAIGRGVKPGDYRVRIDDVDPVSGSVKSRAEVAFNVPVPVNLPSPPAVAQLKTGPAPAAATAAPAAPAASGPSPPAIVGRGAAASAGASSPLPPGNQVAAAAPGGRDVPTGTVMIPDINTTIVSRGDNLWRISHRIYGKGVRYTVIYGANQSQIRNPNRIYPGQVFVVPGEQQASTGN